MFRKVLIANRGEIACRIVRTLRRLGVGVVTVYSEPDRHARHVLQADEAVCLGPGPASESYLCVDKVLAAATRCGAEAIHPGYGFLSENADFAEACAAAGITFIGPTPSQLRDFGLKHSARQLATSLGIALAPGSELLPDLDTARREAQRIGYPLMLKSTAGGGGIGMQRIRSAEEFDDAFTAVERLAARSFSRGGVFLERYVEHARHIEVQIFGDGHGKVVALGERDCSTQRRNQKIIEETPAPNLPDAIRGRLHAAAIRLAAAVNYRSAGTVEFIYDVEREDFYFLEVNTRLQVEHGVTEEVFGIDLVEWMIRLAAGEPVGMAGPAGGGEPARVGAPSPRGTSIEVRLYAEDPARNFRPSAGVITHVRFPADVRVDTWIESGSEVSPFYDPLLAKIITVGADRAEALTRMQAALRDTVVAGIETNLAYLRSLTHASRFASGGMTTGGLEDFDYSPRSIEVVAPGTQTTVQDLPGRLGYWNVGVPPSGPMDDLSFRLANEAVGNARDAAALEITVGGPTLLFNHDAVICLGGAPMAATLGGCEVPFWTPLAVERGDVLRMGAVLDAGSRAYLAIRGGIDVPPYLGSRSTFTLGRFGGHGGRALKTGDVLHVASDPADGSRFDGSGADGSRAHPSSAAIPVERRPRITRDWELGVFDGPHGAPDFFTVEDIEAFFGATWRVHYNSSRTGVRLIGPQPRWARSDGGEAGLHPSNIHDTAYAIGAVDFTGDMPVILGPDGPSLGGFVCPVTLAQSELWKLGQLRADDEVRFVRMAAAGDVSTSATGRGAPVHPVKAPASRPGRVLSSSPIAAQLAADGTRPAVVYRRAGDAYLLIEYGPLVLDLELRVRAHALMTWVEQRRIPGIIELTPGIRSLQVHFDPGTVSLARLIDLLVEGETQLGPIEDLRIESRIVHLPLSWDDAATQLAIAKYMQSVRADAPWCPSNIEFIRRINGLDSIDEVKRIVFEASYLVLGLGDVYLGAPVATPLDPRHRLVTTKYNPARTWTPENAVGIGGAYLCVYGMEGPGGYQFVGRTCQMWNTYRTTREFVTGKPWLLRFFDQVRFFPVSAAELTEFRRDFLHGGVQLDVQPGVFDLAEYRRFLAANQPDIAAHKARQQTAFEAERARWAASGQIGYAAVLPAAEEDAPFDAVEPGQVAVFSPVSGSVWKALCAPGSRVRAGDPLVVVESMKMELPVLAPVDGTVVQLRCTEGRAVSDGQVLVVLSADGSTLVSL